VRERIASRAPVSDANGMPRRIWTVSLNAAGVPDARAFVRVCHVILHANSANCIMRPRCDYCWQRWFASSLSLSRRAPMDLRTMPLILA